MTTLQTLLFTPLIAALVARLLVRQPQLTAAVGTLTVGVLWLWLRALEPSGQAVVFWGQPLALNLENQALLLLILAGLFVLLLTLSFLLRRQVKRRTADLLQLTRELQSERMNLEAQVEARTAELRAE